MSHCVDHHILSNSYWILGKWKRKLFITVPVSLKFKVKNIVGYLGINN